MNYTKEQVIEKIIVAYKNCVQKQSKQEILINQVIQEAGFKADEKSEIFKLFIQKIMTELKSYWQY